MRRMLNGFAAAIMAAAMAMPTLAAADDAKSFLDEILERGTLRVGTR